MGSTASGRRGGPQEASSPLRGRRLTAAERSSHNPPAVATRGYHGRPAIQHLGHQSHDQPPAHLVHHARHVGRHPATRPLGGVRTEAACAPEAVSVGSTSECSEQHMPHWMQAICLRLLVAAPRLPPCNRARSVQRSTRNPGAAALPNPTPLPAAPGPGPGWYGRQSKERSPHSSRAHQPRPNQQLFSPGPVPGL